MAMDRTSEFKTTVQKMASKPQFMAHSARTNVPELRARKTGGIRKSSPSSLPNPAYGQFAKFMGYGRQIARDLALTYQKLEKINFLAQKKSLFDGEESNREMNELCYIVKKDIESLHKQIESIRQLQLQNTQSGSVGADSQNVKSHTKNVVLALQHQLASMSSSLKSTLELRSKNMMTQKSRREQFTNETLPILPPTPQAQRNSNRMTHLRSSSAVSSVKSTVIDFGNESDPVNGSDSVRNHQMTGQLLQFEDQTNQHLEERANTMHTIESTIVDLGEIFNQLATMVQTQEEMITRIDHNVEDTLLNVEAAHQSLLQYLASISNNRWLIVKVFGVLFVFFLIFVLFAS